MAVVHLPNYPGSLPVSGFYIVANGHGYGNRDGFRRTWRGGVGGEMKPMCLPELPDSNIIPIGLKVFLLDIVRR